MIDDIDRRIEEINRRLVLSQDSHYCPNMSEYELSEKEHLELWDEMWELKKRKRSMGKTTDPS